MSSDDPFGTAAKAKIFDPDAPIARTTAAQQFASAFPPGYEQEAAAPPADDQPSKVIEKKKFVPKPRAKVSAPDEKSASASDEKVEKPARAKFVRPKVPFGGNNSAPADEIFIAEPKGKSPFKQPASNDEPLAAAAPVASPASSSTVAATPSTSFDDAPIKRSAPASSFSSGFDESNPFGNASKGSRFDPDAPIAKTSAANQMLSEFPPGHEEAPEEEYKPPPKPKMIKKAVVKKPTPAPSSAAPITEPADADQSIPASAAAAFSSSSALANSPPMKPIASSSASLPSMDEFPSEEGGGAEESFSGPIESRLVHKNWKARQQAYDELKDILSALSEDDDDARKSEVSKYESFLKKMVNDVSVPALESGLQAAAVWVDKASFDAGAPAHAEELMTAILKKGFSGRPGTKAASDQIALLLIECGAADAVLAKLLEGTQSNVPKIASACASLLVSALRDFGPGVVAFDKLQKFLPKILTHTNGLVRKEAMDLAGELYRWMGAIFTPALKNMNLKSSQEKELETMFEKIPLNQARPTKFVRSEAGKAVAGGAGKGKKGAASAAADGAFDPMSLVKPVDIAAKLSKGWNEKAVNEKKWQDRKERLNELQSLAEATPKIEVTGGFAEVVGSLKKCLKDSNVVIVGDALKCIHVLAKGTRKGFYSHARQFFPIFVQLMKEKKSNVAAPLTQCLDTFAELSIIEIPDVIDQIIEGLADKVSKVRIEIAQFLQRWIAQPSVTVKSLKDCSKSLAEALYKVVNDGEAEVRNAGTAALAELIATIGRKPVQDLLKRLEATEIKRYQKLDQLISASKKNAAGGAAPEAAGEAAEEEPASKPAAVAKKSSGATSSRPASARSSTAASAAVDEKPAAAAKLSSSASSTSVAAKRPPTAGGLGKAARVERPAAAAAAPEVTSKEVEDNDSVIRRIDLSAKAARIKKSEKKIKGAFREWGNDEIDEMSDALRGLVTEELHGLLFHKDFAKQVTAIDMLDAQLDDHYEAMVGISDLVLKWLSWRLCDANTSVLLKALAFTTRFLQALQAHEYKLSEGEANNFIPFVIEKVFGHNTDRFRNEAREIVQIAQTLYSPKAVFACLVVGYESKNKRVFSECLNESGAMIVKYGPSVCDAKKILLLMANTVGANESHVRTAALGALSAVYQTMGEGIWTLLGGKGAANQKIQAKQMAMIEARFKTIKPNVTSTVHVDEPVAATSSAAAPKKDEGSRTPRRATMPRAPAASPPSASKSAQVSPRSSISGPAAHAATATTPRRSTQVPSVGLPRPSTSTSAPVSSSQLDANGLPNCFSLDLEVPSSFASSEPQFSRTAPSSPGTKLSASSTPSVQSATTSPHARLSASAAFSKAVGKPQLVVPSAKSVSSDPALIEQLKHYMDSSYSLHLSEDEKMDVMKQLWEIVLDNKAAIVGQGDEIVAFLTHQIEVSFSEKDGAVTVNHRHCRYALNTLLEIFKVEEIAVGVKVNTLSHLTRLLLLKLMDDRLKLHPDPQCRSLTMAVNVLVLKVLENSDRTATFHNLLQFLRTGTGVGAMTEPANKTFVDLVVRSLMKLTKNLSQPQFLDSLKLSSVIRDIHEFVSAQPNALVGEELSIKAIKAMLNTLVSVRREEIRKDIPHDVPHSSPTVNYIERLIQHENTKNGGVAKPIAAATPVAAAATPIASPIVSRRLQLEDAAEVENDAASSNRNPVAATNVDAKIASARLSTVTAAPVATTTAPSADVNDPVQQQLAEIVARTIKPATTQSALKDLYEFTVANPTVDIWGAFKQQGESFRAYVKRNLTRMAAEQGVAPPPAVTATATAAAAPVAVATPVSVTPAASPLSSPVTATRTVETSSPAAAAPTGSAASSAAAAAAAASSTALYRQRLSVLQDRAKLATASQAAGAAPAATAAPVAASTASVSGSATIDAIRARFKSARSDENSMIASNNGGEATPVAASTVLTPSVTQQAAAPAAPTTSSIEAIKARIAAMSRSSTASNP